MRQDEIGRERDKRILDPNSAHTRPGVENQEKKQEKNSKNQRKNFSALFLVKSGMKQAEKERKEFQTRIPLILDPGEKIPKKIAKKFKKLKNNFPAFFVDKIR